ncbi:hypothetical protein Hanom_Chr02g00131121 [Helianthus anomalus]
MLNKSLTCEFNFICNIKSYKPPPMKAPIELHLHNQVHSLGVCIGIKKNPKTKTRPENGRSGHDKLGLQICK